MATLTASAALSLLPWGGRALAQQSTVSLANAPNSRETEFDVSANILYDSNIARSDKELATARGLSLADVVATPRADFTLSRQIGREILFLEGSAGYVFHRQDTILNRENIDVAGGVNARVARCQELLTGQFTSQQSDLADLSRTVVSDTVNTTTAGLAADCGRATGLAPTASITQTWRDNSAVQEASIDSRTLTSTVGVSYRRPLLGVISLFGNYSQTDFPRSFLPFTTNGQTLGYDYYGGGISYDRHLGGRIEGVLSLSYTILDPNSTILAGFHGLTYSADVTYQFNFRTQFHVSASRATTPTNRPESSYSISEVYQADISYMAASRLRFSLVGSSKTQDYPVVQGLPVDDLSHQTIDSVFATATFKFTQRLSLSLNVGDEERRANFRELSYSSTRVGLTATANF